MTARSTTRVAMVAYSEYPFDQRIRNEAEALAEAGYQVHVVAARPKSGASPSSINNVHIHELPLVIQRGTRGRYFYQYATFFLLSSVLLTRLHVRRRFEIVHIHTLPDFQVFAAVFAKLTGAKVLLDLHEAFPEIIAARFGLEPRSVLVRLAAALEFVSCRFADQLVVANDGIREAIVRRGIPDARFVTLYNAGNRPVKWVDPEMLRAKYAIPAGRYIVHAGIVNQERDLGTLVRALDGLALRWDMRLLVAGEGDPNYLSMLESEATRIGLRDRIHFLGNLPIGEARSLMSLAAIGLVTLERNPLTELAWPTRIVEFAGLGKPLVLPDLQFIRRTMGEAAYYYAPGNPASLREVVNRLMESLEEARVRSERARDLCLRFEWPAVRDRLLRLYGALTKSQDQSASGRATGGADA